MNNSLYSRIKKYEKIDVRFANVHMIKINDLLRINLFDKNDLFINAITLWEIMQEEDKTATHNCHGLTPNDIVEALETIADPYAVFETKMNRYAIITTIDSHYSEKLMIIIEIGAELINRLDANINKIVTIYPKDDVDKYLSKIKGEKLLFKK